MSERWFVDTNVLVYVADGRYPDQQSIARELFSSDTAERLVLSTQVLGEFFVTAVKKLGMSVSDCRSAIESLAAFPVIAIGRETVLAAVDTATRHELSYWDALIIETAASAGCTRVLTEDLTHGQTIRNVEVVNPFL